MSSTPPPPPTPPSSPITLDIHHAARASSPAPILRDVLPNEIPGIRTTHISLPPHATHTEPATDAEDRVYLILSGTGELTSNDFHHPIAPETIAHFPLGWTVEIKATPTTADQGLDILILRQTLTPPDREDLITHAAQARVPYLKTFAECPPYGESIKSPKTISRTLLPKDIVPRMAIGTVETTGPDQVAPHRHPMLEQYFLGLTNNDITVIADDLRVPLKPHDLYHIPLGSLHGAEVAPARKLHYIWMDFFQTRDGQAWLNEHKPLPPASDAPSGGTTSVSSPPRVPRPTSESGVRSPESALSSSSGGVHAAPRLHPLGAAAPHSTLSILHSSLGGPAAATSRDRILTALSHREPDRVPRDLSSTTSSGISAIAYDALTRRLALPAATADGTRIFDVVQQLALPADAILDRFRIDALDFSRATPTTPADWQPFTLHDGTPAYVPAWFNPIRHPDGTYEARINDRPVSLMPPASTVSDQTYFPYEDAYPDNFDDLDAAMSLVQWKAFRRSARDHSADSTFWQDLRARALALRASTDRAIIFGCGCNLFEWGTYLRRIDNFLCDLLLEPDTVERLLDALMQRHMATLEKVCAAVGDIVDVVRFGDDLGTDTGPFMQPDLYRRLFKPRQAQLCAYAHKHSKMKTYLHSCGSIYKLLPDLIEAGYDILNPVQTSARDMDPARLKREFGRDITFWGGGCDTRRVLNTGTPQQVRDHVRERLDILAPGGGFVFAAIHNIMPDVPPDNIIAMFDALDE